MDGSSDAEVIAAAIANPPRFADIYDRHAGVVFRFLVRRVGREDADELLGETFRIAFERRHAFDTSRSESRPWLYGIASNLVAKHRRSEGRRLRATARIVADRPPAAQSEAVDAIVDARRVLPDLVDAISELPDTERDVLLLYAWEELSYDEIALALEVPVGTVRSRLNRARGRLRHRTAAPVEGRIES